MDEKEKKWFRKILKQLIKHWKIFSRLIIRISEIGNKEIEAPISGDAPEFVQNVLAKIISGDGDELPVSAFPG